MKARTVGIVAFVTLIASTCAFAISGHVTGDTTWSGTVIVTGNVFVDEMYTLSIQPGTIVRFSGNYYIQVDGALMADGTPENRITFT